MKQNKNQTIKSLAKNYSFKIEKPGKLPTIDYVYPDYIKDGNSEAFRFYEGLRKELSDRAEIVRTGLKDKDIAYTLSDSILLEVGEIAPRLGLKELIKNEINSIYSCYSPLLFVGINETDFAAYVVKVIPDGDMAWFELTKSETDNIKDNLIKKAEEKPYKTLLQKILGK
jgi:hypothetical protein